MGSTTDLSQLAVNTYGAEHGNSFLSALENLNPSYKQLIADLPVVARLQEFSQFVRGKRLEQLDPWRARDLFRASLGKRRVFRALALVEGDLDRILAEGLESHFTRFRASGVDVSPEVVGYTVPTDKTAPTFEDLTKTGLLEILRDRFEFPRLKIRQDIFLSTSDFAEVAAGAIGVTVGTANRRILIFELDLWNADLLVLGSAPFVYNAELQSRVEAGLGARLRQLDGIEHDYRFDASIEKFAVYGIAPEAIRAVYEISEAAIPHYSTTIGKIVLPQDRKQSFLTKYGKRVFP